jgi:competence protein ComEA
MAAMRDPGTERFKELFRLHQGERRGMLVLIGITTLIFGWAVYEQWWGRSAPLDVGPYRERVDTWLAARADSGAPEQPVELFDFDPNVIERADWLRLGLTDRQVDGIERYREKGGRFRSKQDLARMYSLHVEQVEMLMPHVLLPDSLPARDRYARRHRSDRPRDAHTGWVPDAARSTSDQDRPVRGGRPDRPTHRAVEVNTADSLLLVQLPGIGPSFARGILKYREKLGGYRSLDQFAEVYVLMDKPDALARLAELLVIDTLMVRRLPINTCTVEQLAAHPYAGWKVAKPLIAYRQHHGPFKQLSDIRACVAVDEAVFRKLAPYLTVE